MSKGARFPLGQAQSWADMAAGVVSRYSPTVLIAGSIRRQRPDVGDIDLVVLDFTSHNPWQRHEIGVALVELGYDQTKDGDKIASFTRPGKASLDLYYATEDTFGVTLLVRTGSAGHNMFLAEHGRKLLPSRRLSVARGILNTADTVVASRTEADCFSALGLRYVEPEQREAPEFDRLIRDGEDE